MANQEHTTLVSSEVHQPKHISDSTAADAGKVITPTSGGESELRFLTPSEVGFTYAYGEFGKTQNTDSLSLIAAADTTLDTASQYTILTATTPGSGPISNVVADEVFNMTYSVTNYTLTIPVTGIYYQGIWANLKSDTVSTKVGITFTRNGVQDFGGHGPAKTDIKDSNRTVNMGFSSLQDYTAGDTIGICIAADKTCELTLQDFRVFLNLIRET